MAAFAGSTRDASLASGGPNRKAVAETGTHAESGDTFDNRAIYISRFGKDGKADRVWTVDLDSEDMAQFWQRNPPADA